LHARNAGFPIGRSKDSSTVSSDGGVAELLGGLRADRRGETKGQRRKKMERRFFAIICAPPGHSME